MRLASATNALKRHVNQSPLFFKRFKVFATSNGSHPQKKRTSEKIREKETDSPLRDDSSDPNPSNRIFRSLPRDITVLVVWLQFQSDLVQKIVLIQR